MEELIPITSILCGTGMVVYFIHSVRMAVSCFRSRKQDDRLLAELQSLREEVRQLKQQQHDLILGVDSSLDRMDRQLAAFPRVAARAEERETVSASRR